MATPMGNVFDLPFNFNPGDYPQAQSHICVVSVIGKGRLNPFSSKAAPLNPVVDKNVFQGTENFLQAQISEGKVECYFDSDSKVMYLHLLSVYDVNLMVEKCKLCQDDPQAFYASFQDEDLKHAKTLILLFTLSHIVLLHHPGSVFDLTYLKLFYTLDTIRLKLLPKMCDVLNTIPGVSKEWADFGRVCTPRMLFLFETSAVDVQPDDLENTSLKPSKKSTPIKKLQNCVEDMIYRILRKTRLITNISLYRTDGPTQYPRLRACLDLAYVQWCFKTLPSQKTLRCSLAENAVNMKQNNSLFSIPINQQYVYIQYRRQEVVDPVEFFMLQIKQRCFPPPDENQVLLQKPKPYSQSRRKTSTVVPEPLPHSVPSTLSASQNAPSLVTNASKYNPATTTSSSSKNQEQCLKEFLWQHIELVFSKSINDNMGKHGIQPIFEVPTLSTWLRVTSAMYRLFFSPEQESGTGNAFNSLRSMLDISMRFSENRCKKVVPLAESAYQQDLPHFYITAYHISKLNKAKRVFTQYARGPAFDKYLEELEKSCEAFWHAGRQQCEALSLTGNLCNSKLHRLPQEVEGENDKRPVGEHVSVVRTKAACNCGRIQMEKEDPFTHKNANYDFYQNLEASCCSRLEHIPLPVFTPTTPDARAVIFPFSEASQGTDRSSDTGGKDGDKPDTFATLSELSLALSLGQAAVEPRFLETQEDKAVEDGDGVSKGQLLSKCGKALPTRQASTTEYLAHMIHSRSPPGLLPLYPAFSLCRLGAAGYYSHVMGLDLPGFLPGSNYLLPWDIPVHNEQEKWPTVSEALTGSKKRQQRKSSKPTLEGGDTVTSVRVYLGMEYECPRGHRFFCSGPDKIIKISANSIVKDNASRLVNLDMPLYTPCHCKQPKGCMSQMMRVYIVTPRDVATCVRLRVQINPFIQPCPPPCSQFHPGLDAPLELPPDGVWVLRLPHIYQDEQAVYLMPTDQQSLHGCYLTKGMFSYSIL